MLNGIVQIALASADPRKLAAWYRDVLGIPPAFEADGMTFFQAGAMRFMIGPTQPGQPVGGDAIIYFDTKDWAAANKGLEAKGVAFLGDATAIQRAEGRELMVRAFKDPEGHRLALLGWRPI